MVPPESEQIVEGTFGQVVQRHDANTNAARPGASSGFDRSACDE